MAWGASHTQFYVNTVFSSLQGTGIRKLKGRGGGGKKIHCKQIIRTQKGACSRRKGRKNT